MATSERGDEVERGALAGRVNLKACGGRFCCSENRSGSSKVAFVGGTIGVRAATGGHLRCSGFGWLSLAGRAGCLATGATLRRDGLYALPKKCQRFFVTHLTKNEPPTTRLTGQFLNPILCLSSAGGDFRPGSSVGRARD